MADEMVTLRIRVVGNSKDIKDVNKQLEKMSAQNKGLKMRLDQTSKSMGGLNDKLKDWNKRHKALSKGIGELLDALGNLGKMTVKLGTIGFAGILASLSALNGAFAIGNLAIKAYRFAMAGLAGAAATALAAVSAFAAAQRELVAATNAYTNKSAPALGSAFNQSRAALRNLQHDSQLASVGMQSLNAAFAAVSKNASFDAKAQKALKALDDFASAGGDRGKNLTAAGEFYGLMAKAMQQGKFGLTAEIEKAGKAISPAFEKGLKEFKKKGGAKNLKTLQDAILSGDLAKMGGVQDQARTVSETLINTFKGYFVRIQAIFADLGQPMLEPIKQAAKDVFYMIRDTIARIAPEIQKFGSGTLLQGLIGALQKITDFIVKLFREYLPRVDGMLKGMSKWWAKFVYVWKDVVDKMGGAVAAGKQVNKIFGGVLLHIFERLGKMIRFTQDLITNNKEKFDTLARVIEKIASGIASLYMFFAETFVNAAPAIERVVDLVFKLVEGLGYVLDGLRNFGNRFSIPGLGDLAVLVAMMSGAGIGKGVLKGKYGGNSKVLKGASNVVGGTQTLIYGAGGKGSGGGAAGKVNPFTKGYSRGRAQGQGITSSIGRGLSSQGKSISKGRAPGRIITDSMQSAGTKLTGGKGLKGFMGKRMGLGGGILGGMLFQGLGGKFLDSSAQSGVQLGSSMMSLGLPPGLSLGAGLGMAAWNAKTPGGGALLGAGAGASIGAMAGGPVGAVIGAAIGGVAGAIKGMWNRANNEKKASRQAVTELFNGYKTELLAGMVSGAGGKTLTGITSGLNSQIALLSKFKGMKDYEKKAAAGAMLKSGKISQDEYNQITRKQLDTYTGELVKQKKVMEDAARGPLKTYNNRMGELTQMTGKSQDEIHKLSMEMGVNLYDDTLSLSDAMKKLGLTVDITAEGIIGATRDIAVKSMGVFDKVINAAEATKVLDDAAEQLRQLGTGAGKEDFAQFYRTAYEQLQILNPEASQFELNDKFMKTFGAGGTAYTQAGGPLYGLGKTAAASGGIDLVTQFGKENLASQQGALADQVISALSGSNLSANRADILKQIQNLSPDRASALQARIAAGDFSAFVPMTKNAASSQAERALSLSGLSIDVVEMAKTLPEQLSIEAEKLKQELVNGITEGFANEPDWYNKPPEWFNKESFKALTDDTHTPRGGRIGDSRVPKALSRTLSRHNYFDSIVSGTRTVQSSYRTWGLGSINSDHVTGRAYDLTGQNLGMYASAVNGAGGFAEFHGTGGNRHLHVVPGPTPVGDMTTPRFASAMMSSPTVNAGSDNVTINVYGAAGQDENVLAQRVITLLEKRQRSTRERM